MPPHLITAAILCVAALAWWRGAPAEKFGGLSNAGASLLFWAAQGVLPSEAIEPLLLALDGFLALTFLFLAVRYASIWLGVAMLLQGAQFSLHAFYLVSARAPDALFGVVNNLISFGVLCCILFGTVASWRQRERARSRSIS